MKKYELLRGFEGLCIQEIEGRRARVCLFNSIRMPQPEIDALAETVLDFLNGLGPSIKVEDPILKY